MAIKLKVFWKRFWVAVGVIIPVIALPIYFGGLVLLSFGAIVVAISLYELFDMYRLKYNKLPAYFLLAYPLVMVLLGGSYLYPQFFSHSALFWVSLVLVTFFITEIFFIKEAGRYFQATYFWRAVIYVGFFTPYLLLIRMSDNGLLKIFLLILMVSFYDIFAYLIGVSFGKHRFFPSISPKKSVEGCFGGVAGMILGYYVFLGVSPGYISLAWWQLIFLILGFSFLAQFGDLVESSMKRLLLAKDSGALIPGHGGLLDRMDAFILIAPIYYFGIGLVM